MTGDPVDQEPAIRWGRRGLGIVLAGLAIQLGATLSWSPGTFILSAAVGVPLVVAGAGVFGWAVLRRKGLP
jgi:hypothetical protein